MMHGSSLPVIASIAQPLECNLLVVAMRSLILCQVRAWTAGHTC